MDRASASRGDGTAGHRDTAVNRRALSPDPRPQARVFAVSRATAPATADGIFIAAPPPPPPGAQRFNENCGSNVNGGDRIEAGRHCGAVEPHVAAWTRAALRNNSLSHPLVGKDVRQCLNTRSAATPLRQPRLHRRGAIFETRTFVQSSTVRRPIERKPANGRGRYFHGSGEPRPTSPASVCAFSRNCASG